MAAPLTIPAMIASTHTLRSRDCRLLAEVGEQERGQAGNKGWRRAAATMRVFGVLPGCKRRAHPQRTGRLGRGGGQLVLLERHRSLQDNGRNCSTDDAGKMQ